MTENQRRVSKGGFLPTLGWLHISDLHRGMSTQGCLWPNVEDQFFADLEAMHKLCGPWHILFFTGDLVQKGARSEFERFDETMQRLYKKLDSLGSRPTLVSVPGNHDLTRPAKNDLRAGELKAIGETADFWRDLRDDDHAGPRKLIREVFRNYSAWQRKHPFPRPQRQQNGILPGDFAATLLIQGLRIGVIGLNSTFLQLTEGDYKGKLAISMEQVVSTCGEHYTDWFKSHTCSFLLTHHPPSWFDARSQESYSGELATPGRFAAHLYGHMHESLNIAQSLGGAQAVRFWQAPSLFGLEQVGGANERRHGYAAGTAVVAEKSGTFRLWPRRAQRHQAGHWHFVGDTSLSLEADGGTRAEQIPVNPVVASPQDQKLFKVLLLATDKDLQAARDAVSEHLRKSLGIDVGHDVADAPQRYQVVVLIQGLLWEGGKAARAWEASDAGRRVAFLSDDRSDWPPHRFVDISAHAEVDAFRFLGRRS